MQCRYVVLFPKYLFSRSTFFRDTLTLRVWVKVGGKGHFSFKNGYRKKIPLTMKTGNHRPAPPLYGISPNPGTYSLWWYPHVKNASAQSHLTTILRLAFTSKFSIIVILQFLSIHFLYVTLSVSWWYSSIKSIKKKIYRDMFASFQRSPLCGIKFGFQW